ncbi:hypothetical protein GN244_ATG15325 [Phytophthora infestans]|uniref:RxLR effector protein n=1 Tax=Phytophthora infestans TaxID=4787 RepID=A0A833ST57_PHYIN|nr:hypothetical protein GN244_ATG15325 [Phytophthora infestans]
MRIWSLWLFTVAITLAANFAGSAASNAQQRPELQRHRSLRTFTALRSEDIEDSFAKTTNEYDERGFFKRLQVMIARAKTGDATARRARDQKQFQHWFHKKFRRAELKGKAQDIKKEYFYRMSTGYESYYRKRQSGVL